MRVLRFLRPARSAASAVQAAEPNDALGLDAFATETPAAAPATPETVNIERFVLAVIVLGAIAVLEAIPTILWLRSQFVQVEPVATIAAAPIVPTPLPPEAAATAVPCAPTPAEQQAGPAVTASAAATTGNVESARPAAPRAAAPGLAAGLVAITTPVPMHVYAGGRLVGTTESDSIMLPVGEHDLELVSEAIGFRARRAVDVQSGRTTTVRIDPPRVPVHINAIPWAEVWIDNQRIGETPIGNLQQTIGSHEVIFRHPELGERRMVVVVTMKEPARISMDLRKR